MRFHIGRIKLTPAPVRIIAVLLLAGLWLCAQAADPDFTLSVVPENGLAIATGGYELYTQYRITVKPVDGFSGVVHFSLAAGYQPPPQVQYHFDYPYLTVSGNKDACTMLLVSAPIDVEATGAHLLRVVAESGEKTHTIDLTLYVNNFTFAPDAPTKSVQRRGSCSFTFAVTPELFAGNLYFQVFGNMKGATAAFNPRNLFVNGVPAQTVLTITTKGSTPPGTYELLVSPSLYEQESRISVTVQ